MTRSSPSHRRFHREKCTMRWVRTIRSLQASIHVRSWSGTMKSCGRRPSLQTGGKAILSRQSLSAPIPKSTAPRRSGRMCDIGLAEIPPREDQFGVRISGFITPGEEGDYRFSLASDDGSKLFIDGREILNNDGMHAVKEVSAPVRLAKGKHALLILYFARGGDQSLSLSIEGPHSGRRRVPP